MWGDSSKYILQTEDFTVNYIAGTHPLYRCLSSAFVQLVPYHDVALILNLFSAILGSLVCAAFYLLLRTESVRKWVAFSISIAFGASHIQWLTSVMAESYQLTILVLIIIFIYARKNFFPGEFIDDKKKLQKLFFLKLFFLSFLMGLLMCNFVLMIPYAFVLLLGCLIQLFKANRFQVMKSFVSILAGTLIGTSLVWGPMLTEVFQDQISLKKGISLALDLKYTGKFFWQDPVLLRNDYYFLHC